MLHLRPLGGDTRWYNPERDIAFLFPRLVKGLLSRCNSVDEVCQRYPWIRYAFEQETPSNDDLNRLGLALGRYVVVSATDVQVQNPAEAKAKAGLHDLPQSLLLLFYAVLGMLVTNGYFYAVREKYRIGTKPPEFVHFLDELDL
jgi:hypothetical protein